MEPAAPSRASSSSRLLPAGLRRAVGVSRVARVTGLDRTGVEVACAVRPRGHVLQVSNGKGEDWARAEAGAVLEATELWAAETVDPSQLVWGSRSELARRLSDEVWGADRLGSAGQLVAPELWSDRTRMAWRVGVELATGRPLLAPAGAVHCPPPGSPPLGPALVRWTSNGMGAHPDREAALLHALLEAIERDQLARALPRGWTGEEMAGRMLARGSLERRAPRAAAWAGRLEQRGFAAFLFDLTPRRGSLGVPLGGALLFDLERGPMPLAAGYACAGEPDAALLGALLEAAQSRVTDIHGAREDVSASAWEDAAGERARRSVARVVARRSVAEMPRLAASGPGESVAALASRLSARGLRAAAFDLAPADLGVHVIKVVAPGLRVSFLLG